MKYLFLASILLLFTSCGTDSLEPNEADITFTVTQNANTVTDMGFKSVVEIEEIHSTNIDLIRTSIIRNTIEIYSNSKIEGLMRGVVIEKEQGLYYLK